MLRPVRGTGACPVIPRVVVNTAMPDVGVSRMRFGVLDWTTAMARPRFERSQRDVCCAYRIAGVPSICGVVAGTVWRCPSRHQTLWHALFLGVEEHHEC